MFHSLMAETLRQLILVASVGDDFDQLAQDVARVRARKLAAVSLIHRFDGEPMLGSECMNVGRPSRAGIVNRRAAALAGHDQFTQRPGITTDYREGAAVHTSGDDSQAPTHGRRPCRQMPPPGRRSRTAFAAGRHLVLSRRDGNSLRDRSASRIYEGSRHSSR